MRANAAPGAIRSPSMTSASKRMAGSISRKAVRASSDTGNDTGFAGVHLRRRGPVRGNRRIGGDITGAAEIFQKRCANLIFDHQGGQFGAEGRWVSLESLQKL